MPAPEVAEATPGLAADIAAEKAYLDSMTAPDSKANIESQEHVVKETPAEPAAKVPTVKAAIADPRTAPTDSTPKPTDTPKLSDEARAKFVADYKAEFPDATDEEANAAADEEGQPVAVADADDDEEFPDTTPEKKPASDEFTDELEKHGVRIKLDDIKDPVARKFIETRLGQLEKGWHRAMADARSYRKDEIGFRTEQRFQQEHPVEDVVSRLLADPELLTQVNARLDELESPTARKAHDVVVRDAKAQARSTEEQASARAAQRLERGEQVERYAVRAAEKAGVPYELGIAESIVALVLSRGDDGDVSKAEVDQIIKEKAEKYQRSIRAHKREDRKKYLQRKAEDAKTAGLPIKPGVGVAPGVGKKPIPKDDDEFIAQFIGAG